MKEITKLENIIKKELTAEIEELEKVINVKNDFHNIMNNITNLVDENGSINYKNYTKLLIDCTEF